MTAPPTPVETTTTTIGPPPSISTTTTTAAPPVTTTTSPPQPEVQTHQLIGGQVTIAVSPFKVTLVGAVPSAGFAAEIEDGGPDEVKVEFESPDHNSSFRARWEDGRLDIDTDEEAEND